MAILLYEQRNFLLLTGFQFSGNQTNFVDWYSPLKIAALAAWNRADLIAGAAR
jgi:hypothetical protein